MTTLQNFTQVEADPATFLSLTDTPADYIGGASKFLKVNAAGNALEYVADPVLQINKCTSTIICKFNRHANYVSRLWNHADATSNNNPTFTGAVDFTGATSRF